MPELITVRGRAELMARTGHLLASLRTEFACAARDLRTWHQPATRAAVGARTPNLSVRKLLSPVALATESAREHLRTIAAHGARVRIVATPLPRETILIDRRIMIVAGAEAPGGREYTVTTAETLVGGMLSVFDAAWENATDVASFLAAEHTELPDLDRDILRALSEGSTDEVAARTLGISVRTYRRRVADLMRALDADSRFQAGARAGALGLGVW